MQRDLFDDIDLIPTPSMERGESSVWQCHWCGCLVCLDGTDRPGPCPSCQHADVSWSKCERSVWGRHYSGPFRLKEAAAIARAFEQWVAVRNAHLSKDTLTGCYDAMRYAAEHILDAVDYDGDE